MTDYNWWGDTWQKGVSRARAWRHMETPNVITAWDWWLSLEWTNRTDSSLSVSALHTLLTGVLLCSLYPLPNGLTPGPAASLPPGAPPPPVLPRHGDDGGEGVHYDLLWGFPQVVAVHRLEHPPGSLDLLRQRGRRQRCAGCHFPFLPLICSRE